MTSYRHGQYPDIRRTTITVLLNGLIIILGMNMFWISGHAEENGETIGLSIFIVSSLIYWIAIGLEAGPKRSCLVSVLCGAIIFSITGSALDAWLLRPIFTHTSTLFLWMFLSAHVAFHLELYISWCTNTVGWIARSLIALKAS